MLRDWKVQPIGGILGIVQKEEKEIPKMESLWIMQKAESDPQRCFGRKNVKILEIVQQAERDPQD